MATIIHMGCNHAQLVLAGELVLLLTLGSRFSATAASAGVCEELLSRLPQACDRYTMALGEQGGANELTRDGEAWLDDEWIHGLRAARDSAWNEVARTVVIPESGFVPTSAADNRLWGRLAADTTKTGDESVSCRGMLAGCFHLPEGPVFFTIGRSAEFCSEVPIMIFEQGGERVVQPLPDVWAHNVEALWCTGRYLVMNLRAEYEFGGRSEGIAFWNLESGWIRAMLALTRSGVDAESKEPIEDPTEGPGLHLRDLGAASVREEGDRSLVKTGAETLVFWPTTRDWMAAEVRPVKP